MRICVVAAILALCVGLLAAPQAKAVNAPSVLGDNDVNVEEPENPGDENPSEDPADVPQEDPGENPGEEPAPAFAPYWIEEGGKYYYVIDELGTRATGWLELDGVKYWLGTDGARATNTWVKIDNIWRYFDENGAMVANTFRDINGSRYFFNADGTVQTGFITIEGETFYAGSDGKLYHDSWLKTSDTYYYFGSDYKMYVNTYTVYKGAVYWFGWDGKLCFGWIQTGTDWLYAGSNAKLYRNKWLKENGSYYYFNNVCVMLVNEFVNYNGATYRLGPEGKAIAGWINANDAWYYAGSNGKVVSNQWVRAGNKYYRIGSNQQVDLSYGVFVKTGGSWYHQKADGSYTKGWANIGENWYYFYSDGRMAINTWVTYKNNDYYLGSNGALYINRTTPDGSVVNDRGQRMADPMDAKAQGYSSKTGYLIMVSYDDHIVSIYSGAQNNWKRIKRFSCAMGSSSTPTPTGVYSVTSKIYSFGDGANYTCYYATGFVGTTYLFHSVLYDAGTFNLQDGRLGLNISHGCVRLDINDAKWIYDNIPYGTTVVIY